MKCLSGLPNATALILNRFVTLDAIYIFLCLFKDREGLAKLSCRQGILEPERMSPKSLKLGGQARIERRY